MRGRTNVMQRKEPTINAGVKNCVVKSGNTVIKGDFVSYTLQTDIKQRDNIDTVIEKKRYSDNVYICCTTDYTNYSIRIVDVTTDFEIKDSLDFTSMTYFDIDSQGRVYVGNETTISVYNIVNSQFSLIGSATTTKTIAGALKLNSDGQFGVLTKQFNGTSTATTDIYLQIITVGENSISLSTEAFILTIYTRTDVIEYTGYLNDGTFLIVYEYSYLSGSTGYIYADKCQYVNGVFSYTRQSLVTLSSSNNSLTDARFCSDVLRIKYRLSSVNVKYWCLIEGDLTEISFGSGLNVKDIYPADEDYYVYCYNYTANPTLKYYVKLFHWDNENKVMTAGEQINTTKNGEEWFKQKGNQIVSYTPMSAYSDVFLWLIDTENFDITAGYFSNIVEAYNGNYTVGFAKTGGVGGDTIQVYIPQVSS